jgi:hypothetical protein
MAQGKIMSWLMSSVAMARLIVGSEPESVTCGNHTGRTDLEQWSVDCDCDPTWVTTKSRLTAYASAITAKVIVIFTTAPLQVNATVMSVAGPANQPEFLPNSPTTQATTHPHSSPPVFCPAIPPCKILLCPHSTPIKLDSSTTMPYTSGLKYCIPGRREKGQEMSKYIIGPTSGKLQGCLNVT